MNKKILAILMALMMVLTSVAAFAAGETTTTIPEETSFQLTKAYSGTGKPNETFTFAATAVTEGAPALSLGNGTITNSGDLTVTVPGVGENGYAAKPGVYEYTITETAGNTLGTIYDSTVYNVKVTVYNAAAAGETPDYKTTIAIRAQGANEKTDKAAFTNTYAASEAALVVKKLLAGNAADMSHEFTIEVAFESNDTNKVLKSTINATGDGVTVTWKDNVATIAGIGHNETVTFTNLPVGTKYTVTETGDKKGYTDTYTNKTGVIADANVESVVTNTMTTDIDTGVNTDNMPYIMLMAFVMILAAAVVLKKRTVNE